ncbi:MAG: peptidylprolyl isomerase, partial [Candidatus Thorarchaeota archaeon]
MKLETEKGDIYLELFDDKTPVTVGNFLDLVGTGFYDGLTFHRVISDFMIQGGDPQGDGSGGPGFTIPDEADKGLKHLRGSLSMAKTSAPNTGGSQFFICHTPQPHLDGVHTVFGKCIQGMEVVDRITKGDKILKATILKKSPRAD